MGERLDPESTRRVMSRYFDAMREAIERHGGTVEKFIGDAGHGRVRRPGGVHEDDALRAVRAAADMRAALAELNEELDRDWGVRIESRNPRRGRGRVRARRSRSGMPTSPPGWSKGLSGSKTYWWCAPPPPPPPPPPQHFCLIDEVMPKFR